MKIPGIDENEKDETIVITKGSALGPTELQSRVKMAPKLFDVAEIEKRIEPYRGEINRLGDVAENFVINSDMEFEKSVEMTGQAKSWIKAIEGAVRAVTDDYFNFYKAGLNMGKALTSIIEARILNALETKQNNYSYQKELARREAEAKARAEAEAFQKKLNAEAKKKNVAPVTVAPPPVVPKATTPVKTQSGTMSSKMVWDFEFTDFKTKEIFDYVLKVCAGEYIKVAEKAIKKMIKAGLHEGIKGVRFFERAQTKHRAR